MTPRLKKIAICLLVVLWLILLAAVRAISNILSRR
jgi:hypothetical protein